MTHKIRILQIQETIGSGGVEIRRLSLAKKMDKARFQLKIICTKTTRKTHEKIREEGVEVIPIGLLNHPFQWSQHKKVQQIIDEYQPHIIHGAVFEGVTMATINGFYKKVPIKIIEETSDPQNRSWKGNLLMRIFGKLVDCAIGVSPASVDYLIQKAHIASKKVCLINNGVTIPRKISEEEVQTLKAELNIRPDDIVIGSVGRMLQDEQKRFSDLIKAFAKVYQRNPNTKLLMIGDGPQRKGYKELAEELGVDDQVIFTGYQEDTANYYAVMDIFALTSAYEAFGLVLAEAMLHKLPVVATRVGGMQYIVKNEKTGFLVERFQIDEIAEKLECLVKDEKLRKAYGEAGYQRAMENYTEDIYVKNVEQLYLELLEGKGIKL